MGQLFIWSAVRGEWVSYPPDEITWLDRGLLSGNEDLSLHRAPRCPGLRHVHRRWELFSRDPTYRVYVAPQQAGRIPADAETLGAMEAGGQTDFFAVLREFITRYSQRGLVIVISD